MSEKPRLVSFKLCPYVQRSVITLLEKGIAFDIRFIELADPPDWFLALSPMGKVPVLETTQGVLFESAVINDYLDEVNLPHLAPEDAFVRAQHRAWTEFASMLVGKMLDAMVAKDAASFQQLHGEFWQQAARLESELATPGPFFAGEQFSLVDTAFAPAFMRMQLLQPAAETNPLADLPRLKTWVDALLAHDSVKNSVVEDFKPLFYAFLCKKNSFAACVAKEQTL